MNDQEAEKLRKQFSALGFQIARQYKEIMYRLDEQHTVMIRNLKELQRMINDVRGKMK